MNGQLQKILIPDAKFSQLSDMGELDYFEENKARAQLLAKTAEVEACDKTIAEKIAEVEARDSTIAEKIAEVEARDKIIAEQTDLVEMKISEAVKSRDKKIEEQSAEIKAKQAQVTALDQTNTEMYANTIEVAARDQIIAS